MTRILTWLHRYCQLWRLLRATAKATPRFNPVTGHDRMEG